MKAKMFRKDGYEGIWRAESKKLDVYEVDDAGNPYFIQSKSFTNGRVAESYFMKYTFPYGP
tara:strand:- start:544 stop:726 length:183 start_codon:yes stop_codon:yes gene_type:complete